MNLLEIVKSFFEKIFNKNQKLLESSKVDIQNVNNYINQIRNKFEESLKVNLIQINSNLSESSSFSSTSNIESLKCINDGLGFQKIKNY